MTRIICVFLFATIFHNLLIHKPIPEEWEEEITSLAAAMNDGDEDDNNNLMILQNVRINERRKFINTW